MLKLLLLKRPLTIDSPFIVYADIESLLIPMNDVNDDQNERIPAGAFQQHIPNSIAYYFHSRLPTEMQSYFKSNSGPKCVEWFINELFTIAKKNFPIVNRNRPMRMSDSDLNSFKLATHCHICDKKIENGQLKVKDHCHITGKYRGATHNQCNLNFQIPKVLPIVFHNLDYDCHFLIEQLVHVFDKNCNHKSFPLSILPKTSEKYISFTKIVYENDLFPPKPFSNNNQGNVQSSLLKKKFERMLI